MVNGAEGGSMDEYDMQLIGLLAIMPDELKKETLALIQYYERRK